MVETHRVHRAEASEVILVGHVVAVPGDHVERRLAELADMKAAAPLHGEARRLLPVLEGGNRRQEVARVGEAVRADRAALRQGQRRRVVLADEAPRSEEHTSELQSLMRISYAVFCLEKKQTPKKII